MPRVEHKQPRVTTDKFGRTFITLDQSMNTPGQIEVDGDLLDEGPVAMVRFELTSDNVGETQEVTFGTFRFELGPQAQGDSKLHCGVMLGRDDALALSAAVAEKVVDGLWGVSAISELFVEFAIEQGRGSVHPDWSLARQFAERAVKQLVERKAEEA